MRTHDKVAMDFEYRLVFLASILAAHSCIGICSVATCESPQYMTYGKIGTVNCMFHEEFFSVLWFDTQYYRQSEPILHYQDFTTSGAGYDSGEFDIYPNGSLIINNVSLEHETTFTALYVHSQAGGVDILQTLVIVIVKPKEAFPLINYCGNSSTCFAEVGSTSVNCSVGSARPSIALTWVARTVEGDRNITTDMSIKSEGLGYTSRATTGDVFHDSSLLVLLVCKSFGLWGILQSNESVLLAQNKNITLLSTEKRTQYIERYTELKLDCTVGDLGFVVWKKVRYDQTNDKRDHETLLYSIFLGEQWTEVFVNGLQLGTNASLVVPVMDVGHEGLYYCIYGDGLTDGSIVYDVIVKVDPVPPYPVVEGCNHPQYCVLKSDYKGSLTCKLKGIRPQVQLQWNTFLESDALSISFTNEHLTVTEKGEIFDVTLTSTYRVIDMSRDRLTIECKVPHASEKLSHLSTKMDLLFEEDNLDPTNVVSPAPVLNRLTWILPIIIIPLLLLLILCLGVIYRKHWKDETIKSQMKPEHAEEISIEYVRLDNCLQSVDLSTAAIRTTSGLVLTSRIPVKGLDVSLYNRDMTEDEAIAILEFASVCPSLRHLKYWGCVPPRSFNVGPALSTLKTRNVTVRWRWSKDKPIYILNLRTGRWENEDDGSEPREEDFEMMLTVRGERRKGRTEETYRRSVKKGRETLRKAAEEQRSNFP